MLRKLISLAAAASFLFIAAPATPQVAGTVGPHGSLSTKLVHQHPPLTARSKGRGAFGADRAKLLGHVWAAHIRGGKVIENRDLGGGLVTNVGVMAMANDFAWASPSGAAINTLALMKYCATGTGATAAAATDITLQTADAVAVVTGAQSLQSAANSQVYQVTCTMVGYGTEAVTEWGLFNNATLTASTGTPWTAGAANSGTVTGTPYTASSTTVQGEEEFVFEDTTKSPAIYGLCTANTSSVVTVPAWYKVTDGTAAGTTPANTDVLAIKPVMLDHKVFAAINTVSGDSIAITYKLTLASGG